jgi:AmmeMemoRadiSam system protein B
MMTQRFFHNFRLILLSAAVLVVGMVLFSRVQPHPSAPVGRTQTPAGEQNISNMEVSINGRYFYPSVEKYPRAASGDRKIAGGVISHHDLASDLIAQFFSELSAGREIKTFILLGPNHDNIGRSPVISAQVRWQTPIGAVDTDEILLEKLRQSGLVSLDEEHLTPDHAVTALLPFIRYYFPGAKVVPLLFTSEETMNKSTLLSRQIASIGGEDTFVLASLDFSHYLQASQAAEKDVVTLDAIRRRDYTTIAGFNSDNVDSAWTLVTFLRAMELEGASGPQVLRHANSADFPGQDPVSTTSYFSIVYEK